MKRPYILVIVGVVLIIAAIALNYMLTKSADEETAPAATQAPAVTTQTSPSAPASESEQGTTAPEITSPSFDVVRIGPDGNAVIAGRAEPNSTVRIREGEEVIGEATADERGEWVVLPNKPLASGDRELSLEAEDATGTVSMADDKVVVLIPEEKAPSSAPASDDAAQNAQTTDAGESEKQPVIALKVPSQGNGAATVMQGPAPEPAAQNAESETPDANRPRLSIDVVDYDTQGRVAMSARPILNRPFGFILITSMSEPHRPMKTATGRSRLVNRSNRAITPCVPISLTVRVRSLHVLKFRSNAPIPKIFLSRDHAMSFSRQQPVAHCAPDLWRRPEILGDLSSESQSDSRSRPDLSGADFCPAKRRKSAIIITFLCEGQST